MGLADEGRRTRDPGDGRTRAGPGASRLPRVGPPASTRLLTLPNMLSIARLSTVPVFLWLFLSGREDAGVVLYGAGALTDFLDGFIARRTRQISEFGKLLDPLADRVLIAALAVALVARGVLPLWLALAVVARDLLILSAYPLIGRRRIERIPVNLVGKTATALLLIGLTWLALTQTSFGLGRFGDEVGLTCMGLGAVLYWIATVLYGREVVVRWRSGEQALHGDREPLP